VSDLRGYSLPLTPSGSSSIVSPPPWHFSGDFLYIEFRVGPQSARGLLPSGFELAPDDGRAAIAFADWQFCSDSRAELSHPEEAQFREVVVMLACRYGDLVCARYPFAYVDRPEPILRGWIQGLPKKPGRIALTRVVPLGVAGTPLRTGTTFHASLATTTTLAKASVTLTDEVAELPDLMLRPPIHSRLFPAWAFGDPPLEELVVARATGIEFADVWRGDATLELFDAPNDELGLLGVQEVDDAYRFSYAETLHRGAKVAPLVVEG
jgi:enduracididine biosynthesis enzyme MppR